MFANQRGSAGMGGLIGVAGVLAAWIAIAAVMWGQYVAPQADAQDRCQLVCRQVSVTQSKS